MPSYTGAPYNLAKPTVGGDADAWGNNGWASPTDTTVGINDNMQLINYHMFSRVDGGTITGNVTFGGNATVQGSFTMEGAASVVDGNFNVDRRNDGQDAYVTVYGNAGTTRGYRIYDDGGTVRTIASIDAAGNVEYGNTNLDVLNFIASATGRQNFYCGTGNLDAALDSDGFYLFGGTGVATTGPVIASGTIDPNTLAVSGGMQLDYAAGAGYIANASGGEIRINIGGIDKAYFETNGYLYTSIQKGSGGFRIGRGDNHCNLDNVGNVGNINFQFAGTTMAHIAPDGGAEVNALKTVGTDTNVAPAVNINDEVGLYADSSSRLSVSKADGTKLAQFEDIGSTLAADVSVVTREKGDARYVDAATNNPVLGFARVSSGGTFARNGGTITNVAIASSEYTVTYTARSNPVIHVTPVNYANAASTALVTLVYNVTNTTCKVRFRTTGSNNNVQCAFNITVM